MAFIIGGISMAFVIGILSGAIIGHVLTLETTKANVF